MMNFDDDFFGFAGEAGSGQEFFLTDHNGAVSEFSQTALNEIYSLIDKDVPDKDNSA